MSPVATTSSATTSSADPRIGVARSAYWWALNHHWTPEEAARLAAHRAGLRFDPSVPAPAWTLKEVEQVIFLAWLDDKEGLT